MENHMPSDGLVIRPASFNDIETIRLIAQQTWPNAYGQLLGAQQVVYMLSLLYSYEALEKQMQENHYFFLALKDYKPIGFASFSATEKNIFKLQKLYVLPQQQKTGAGLALIKTVEQIVKSMGGSTLILNVNRKNNAKQFYSKLGFTIKQEEDIDIGSGYFMNDYVMEKLLN